MRGTSLVVLMLVVAMLAGCGSTNDDEAAFIPARGTESAYCDTYRGWQVHELNGEGEDQPDPAALRTYWNEYLIYLETSLHQAPPEIRDELEVDARAIRTRLTPLLEKYDFDVERIKHEGTATEQAYFAQPPPDIQKVQDAIHAYQDTICQTGSPPAADVVFKANESSKPYCTVQNRFNSGFEKVAASQFDPDVMRTFITSDSFSKVLDALERTAPDEITADVRIETQWFRTRWSEVIADFDYDIRRILLEGAPEDRAVFTRFHPKVAKHEARIAAYQQQVCTK